MIRVSRARPPGGALREATARTAAAGFAALSAAGRLHPASRPEAHGLDREQDIAYGDLPDQKLDVIRPAGGGTGLPVVLYLHGGAFRSLSKDTHWLFALAFARRGFLVFNANYRLAPRHRFPAAHEDAAAALLWVRRNAARWGGDPDRLVLAGESAGGNLVASLGIAAAWPRPEPWARAVWDAGIRPRAIAACYGAFQVSATQRLITPGMRWPVRQLLLDLPAAFLPRDGGAAELADPVCVLEGAAAPQRPLAPFFLPVGTADPLLPDTERMAAALARFGVPHEARYYPGELHGFHALIWRPAARACWNDLFEFVLPRVAA